MYFLLARATSGPKILSAVLAFVLVALIAVLVAVVLDDPLHGFGYTSPAELAAGLRKFALQQCLKVGNARWLREERPAVANGCRSL